MASTTTAADPRWQILLRKEGSAELGWFYAVKTTGVYCRPSCRARLPKEENVLFFESSADAETAGFRACLKCRPASASDPKAAAIAKACKHIELSERLPKLDELAAVAGMSTYHFHRTFKQYTGLTPADYAKVSARKRLSKTLQSCSSITEAMYDSGFQTSAQFYQQTQELLGMKPKDLRSGGKGVHIDYAIGSCSLGLVLVAQTDRGVCAIFLGDSKQALTTELQQRFASATINSAGSEFAERLAQVIAVIDNPSQQLDLPIDVRGTAFQQRVWNALRNIAPGRTASYTEIAEQLGAPRAVRAVAQACAANKLAVVIPCHRVVRSDGNLSGYRWGVERKRKLLEMEKQD